MSATTHLISAANKVLRSRTDEQWLEMLLALPDSVRDGIAKLVWWDWIGGRSAADRNPKFDQFLKYSVAEYEDKALVEGLLSLGYTEFQATSRVRRAQ